MFKNIKFSYLIIIVLIIILLLQRNCNKVPYERGEIIKVDTLWKTKTDTLLKQVYLKEKVYVKVDGTSYTPTNNIDTCKTRFNDLLKEHLTRSVYVDTINIDSIGNVVITDTVWKNKLYGKRIYKSSYKIPVITKTIIKSEEPKRQMYVGINIFANRNDITAFSPGLIYKNKKDQIYQASIGVSFNGTITYGIGTYWKIKLK